MNSLKNSLLLLSFVLIGFVSCEKYGDIDTDLKGKTFVYHNEQYGNALIRLTLKFEKDGNVYHKSEVGTLSPYDTKGCDLYYKMSGNTFEIYHGTKGWKKDVQHTIYKTGEYYDDYILVEDYKYLKQ